MHHIQRDDTCDSLRAAHTEHIETAAKNASTAICVWYIYVTCLLNTRETYGTPQCSSLRLFLYTFKISVVWLCLSYTACPQQTDIFLFVYEYNQQIYNK